MYTLPHLTAWESLLPQNVDDGDDDGLWHAPTVATSNASSTNSQRKAGGARAAVTAARNDLCALSEDDYSIRTRTICGKGDAQT